MKWTFVLCGTSALLGALVAILVYPPTTPTPEPSSVTVWKPAGEDNPADHAPKLPKSARNDRPYSLSPPAELNGAGAIEGDQLAQAGHLLPGPALGL